MMRPLAPEVIISPAAGTAMTPRSTISSHLAAGNLSPLFSGPLRRSSLAGDGGKAGGRQKVGIGSQPSSAREFQDILGQLKNGKRGPSPHSKFPTFLIPPDKGPNKFHFSPSPASTCQKIWTNSTRSRGAAPSPSVHVMGGPDSPNR